MKDLLALKKEVERDTQNQRKGKRFYAVLFYYTKKELGIEDNDTPVLYRTQFFTDSILALNFFCTVPSELTQLIDGETIEELHSNIQENIDNMNNKKWREKNVTPYT